jgi:hypothetical protein
LVRQSIDPVHIRPMPPFLPDHESLRRAVAWLAEHGRWTPELIDEASRRFDLSPTDEEFLLHECRRVEAERAAAPTRRSAG